VPKMSVLLSSEEEERFAAYCKEKGFKKSTLVARLIREHLDRESYASQKSLPFGTGRQSERNRAQDRSGRAR